MCYEADGDTCSSVHLIEHLDNHLVLLALLPQLAQFVTLAVQQVLTRLQVVLDRTDPLLRRYARNKQSRVHTLRLDAVGENRVQTNRRNRRMPHGRFSDNTLLNLQLILLEIVEYD